MKIVFCLEYPLALRGGVSVLVETLLREFARSGHELVLVSPDSPTDLQAFSQLKLHQHIRWNHPKPSIRDARGLAQQIAAVKPDVVHVHMGGNYAWGNRFPWHCAATYLKRAGIPVITTAHSLDGLFEGYCGPQKPFWFKLLMFPIAWLGKMQQLRSVRFEIAVSQHNLRTFSRWYAPLRNRFVCVYHSRLRGDEPAGSINVSRSKTILNVGHLAHRKGQAVLAEAFCSIAKQIPDWELHFAGADIDGTTTKRIHTLAEQHELNDRIRLLGERFDTPDLMQRAGIYAQPSRVEALGLALQEALFFGCPSVASRVGGIPELIDHEQTGLLVDAGNPAQFAEALLRLIENTDLRERLGNAAAQSIRSKDMTLEGMVKKHLKLYERAIGN